MSVQAGIWNLDDTPIDRKLLKDMSDCLSHQGPDTESVHIDGPIALVYRAFHTTDESQREKQPSISRRGFVITWDGRLDNRDELIACLREDLTPDPTDVEIITAACDRWETECFHRILGDWALSLWKPVEKELIFACDYMCIRHIYYLLTNRRLFWATDLTPLVLLSGHTFRLDENYIAQYFANEPQSHRTPYVEIRQVAAGYFVRIRNADASSTRYWRFNSSRCLRYKSDSEYEEHFRFVFRQSVHRRLRGNSPILGELSGGLDSSSIICMADDILARERTLTQPLDTLSYFDKSEPDGDDWIYFRHIEAKRGKVGCHIDCSTYGRSPWFDEKTFAALPGSLGAAREMEEERHAKVREGGYRIVLSGIGGDEFTGGIPDPSAQIADLILQLRVIALARQLMAWSLAKRRPWIQLLLQAIANLLPPSIAQHFMEFAIVEPWIDKQFAARTGLAARQMDVIERPMLCLPTRASFIAGALLMADKMSKRNLRPFPPMEVRYPYLDRNFVEFNLSIPATQLLRPGDRRSLMRRALSGIVPQEILSRKTKQRAARTPVMAFERNELNIREAFDSPISSVLGFIDRDQLIRTMHEAMDGRIVNIVRLLKAVSLEFWLKDISSRGLIQGRNGSDSVAQVRPIVPPLSCRGSKGFGQSC